MSEVFIGKQPVLDVNMNVFAYELQFHQGLNPNKNTVEATIELIKRTQEKIGFQSIVGKHDAMLHLPKALLNVQSLPNFDENHSLILEIPNDVTQDVALLRSLKELKSEGLHIALENYNDEESSLKLASISDYVKINIETFSELKLKEMLEELHKKGIKVIANKVETEEMFLYLKKLGFDYFLGYFFTNPVIMNGQKLSGNKLTLLQLLAKVNDPTTDFHQLSNIIGQDVSLSHKLLLAINNPATMIPVRVENIADALRYMGLKRLKFWVNMLMLSSMEDVPQELLTTSLMRAKFCELMAESAGHARDKDSYFLMGLFSSLDAFFKIPISEIVSEMPLSEEIRTALVDRKGTMGDALKVLMAMEQAKVSEASVHYEQLGLSEISNSFMAANAWAQQAISS
ncbi:MAG: EAL domain-containing protein [Thiomicrorhabdus sp.]|jgi:EAL and modified HD-GYP domain-containing signal transduction protein|nr:EAL domain-containing protein [Thiomicrorhabdus sp.]